MKSESGICAKAAKMPMAARFADRVAHLDHGAEQSAAVDGGIFHHHEHGAAHSPPSPIPCRKRSATSKIGAARPS